MSKIYENEEGDAVVDCELCKEQIELEANEYYEVGISYKSPMISDTSMDTNGYLHVKCYEQVSEGLIEAIQLLLDQISEEGKVLGFQDNPEMKP